MKVLIIGASRTGTTSLGISIESEGFKFFSEPFNDGLRKGNSYTYPMKEINLYDDLVIKCLPLQIPKNLKLNPIDFYIKFVNEFDKIILLDRRNLKEHEESFLHLNWKLDNKQNPMERWHLNSIPTSYKKEFKTDNRYYDLYEEKKYVNELSKIIKIPITYYEDLYGIDRNKSLKIIKSWNLSLDSEKINNKLDPKNKYRILKKIMI